MPPAPLPTAYAMPSSAFDPRLPLVCNVQTPRVTRSQAAVDTPQLWRALPDELVAHIAAVSPPESLHALARLERRAHFHCANRRACLKVLLHPPFELRVGYVLGRDNSNIDPENDPEQLYHRRKNAFSLCARDIDDSEAENVALAIRAGFLPGCTNVDLAVNNIGAAGISAIAQALADGFWPQLSRLDISNNCLGVDGVKVIARYCIARPHLKILVLTSAYHGGYGMRNEGLILLAVAAVGSDVEELIVNFNLISDEGITGLIEECGERGAFPQLSRLEIRGNQICDAGLQALAQAVRGNRLCALTSCRCDNNPGDELPVREAFMATQEARWGA